MLQNIEKLVVIAGCQRSGTTLTGQIVGAHPKAFLIDENDGLYDWFHSTDSDLRGCDKKLKGVIQKAGTKYNAAHSRLEAALDNHISLNSNISHLVLKAPNLTYSFSRLAKLNIPVLVIFPQRDARSVVASMSKLSNIDMVGNQCRLIKKSKSLAAEFSAELSKIERDVVPDHVKRALIWKIKTEMVQKFVSLDLPTFCCDYDELVSQKKVYCSKFAEHLGLKYSRLMEEHELVYQGFGPGGTNRTREVDTNSMQIWKKILTDQQAHDIQGIVNCGVKQVS